MLLAGPDGHAVFDIGVAIGILDVAGGEDGRDGTTRGVGGP